MKAIKTTGTVDETGQLALDFPLMVDKQSRVEVIVLIPESIELDTTLTKEQILNDFRSSWQEVKEGKTIPVEELWED